MLVGYTDSNSWPTAAVQSLKAVSTHFTSEQILPLQSRWHRPILQHVWGWLGLTDLCTFRICPYFVRIYSLNMEVRIYQIVYAFGVFQNTFLCLGRSPRHLIVLSGAQRWDKTWRHFIHKTRRQAHFIDKSALFPQFRWSCQLTWCYIDHLHMVSHLTVWAFEMVPCYL